MGQTLDFNSRPKHFSPSGKTAGRLIPFKGDVKMSARAVPLRFSPQTYSRLGWLFDKVIATLALAILAPVMLLIALAVKLESRGPVFFRQKRYGFNNELIEVLRFRTIYSDRCNAAAASLVAQNDPRVTRVGRFIRKTSLDELPQLINVVKGDLSLVGARPYALQAKTYQRAQ
jgi:lipopolysaccharide/colanic/teichoic acid biosynthesis glycosyltransferase